MGMVEVGWVGGFTGPVVARVGSRVGSTDCDRVGSRGTVLSDRSEVGVAVGLAVARSDGVGVGLADGFGLSGLVGSLSSAPTGSDSLTAWSAVSPRSENTYSATGTDSASSRIASSTARARPGESSDRLNRLPRSGGSGGSPGGAWVAGRGGGSPRRRPAGTCVYEGMLVVRSGCVPGASADALSGAFSQLSEPSQASVPCSRPDPCNQVSDLDRRLSDPDRPSDPRPAAAPPVGARQVAASGRWQVSAAGCLCGFAVGRLPASATGRCRHTSSYPFAVAPAVALRPCRRRSLTAQAPTTDRTLPERRVAPSGGPQLVPKFCTQLPAA